MEEDRGGPYHLTDKPWQEFLKRRIVKIPDVDHIDFDLDFEKFKEEYPRQKAPKYRSIDEKWEGS